MEWRGKARRSPRDGCQYDLVHPRKEVTGKKNGFANMDRFDKLRSVVSKFTEDQLSLARETGFGSFLRGIQGIELDKQFCRWLLSKVEVADRCITMADGTRIPMKQADVTVVLGLSQHGKLPWDASLDKSISMRKRIQNLISMETAHGTASVAAEKVLQERRYVGTKEEARRFKVAWIIYVVSILVDAPDTGGLETMYHWPALDKIDEINSFNWAFLMLRRVLASCSKAQADERRLVEPNPPAGVMLFLTVISNITFCSNENNHFCFPIRCHRITQFQKTCRYSTSNTSSTTWTLSTRRLHHDFTLMITTCSQRLLWQTSQVWPVTHLADNSGNARFAKAEKQTSAELLRFTCSLIVPVLYSLVQVRTASTLPVKPTIEADKSLADDGAKEVYNLKRVRESSRMDTEARGPVQQPATPNVIIALSKEEKESILFSYIYSSLRSLLRRRCKWR